MEQWLEGEEVKDVVTDKRGKRYLMEDASVGFDFLRGVNVVLARVALLSLGQHRVCVVLCSGEFYWAVSPSSSMRMFSFKLVFLSLSLSNGMYVQ